VRIILISLFRTTFQRVNRIERGKPVSTILPTQVPLQGAIWLARDLRPLPNRDRGDSELNHILHQIRVGRSKTGTFSQTVSFPGAFNDNVSGSYDPSVYIPRAPYTFPVRSCRTLNSLWI
jgi:hypothetical protein